jgi:hypothetical protein
LVFYQGDDGGGFCSRVRWGSSKSVTLIRCEQALADFKAASEREFAADAARAIALVTAMSQ